MSNEKPKKIQDSLHLRKDELEYTINHVFMPPKLPQEHDAGSAEKDASMLQAIEEAASSFCEVVTATTTSKEARESWISLRRMINSMLTIHSSGVFSRAQLRAALGHMNVGDVLPVYIDAQNAGVIFRKTKITEMSFESFQASLPVELVIGTLGKIPTTFPSAPRISFSADSAVLDPLSNILSYLAGEVMNAALPKTNKGGSSHHETRDVASPCYITEALAGILRAGSASNFIPTETTYVHKHLNDEVLWKQAYRPWRRSSIWLVIRVALQTTLLERHADHGFDYKAFQVFFMAKVLSLAASDSVVSLPSDLLHFMNAKLARRLYKLSQVDGSRMDLGTFETATSTMYSVAALLESRWQRIQAQFESRQQWKKEKCPTRIDCTRFTFPNAGSYLSRVMRRNAATGPRDNETTIDLKALNLKLAAGCGTRVVLTAKSIPAINANPELYPVLHDFQHWVERRLPTWKSSESRSIDDCLLIHETIAGYRNMASKHYQSSPERLSLMYLCIIELWIALDELVVEWCPLLADYSPEIPEDVLDPLLLPEYGHVERLRTVQLYLRGRHAKKRESFSVFKNVNDPSSFANRFFSLPLAAPLKALHKRIEATADSQRARKLIELNNANVLHDEIMEEVSEMDCDYVTEYDSDEDEVEVHRPHNCTKCKEIQRARRIKVTPFEELLPKQLDHSQPIVFELECPRPFAIWRDATQDLIDSLYQRPKSSGEAAYRAERYETLRGYFKESFPGQRITLASSAKSISQSHYGKPRSVPETARNIILSHAGKFALYDSRAESYVTSSSQDILREACTFKLTEHYRSLQAYVNNTTHPPNSVIASLHSAPIEISPTEYLAFGHLRSGNRLQWRNIMRALRAESLSFAHYSVFALIVQSIWQAGPAGEDGLEDGNSREAHQDLLDDEFLSQVLDELELVIISLRGNWKQAFHLGVVIMLALRANAFAPSDQLVERSLSVLSKCRKLAREWLLDLANTERTSDDAGSASRSHFQAIIAILLRLSFDVEFVAGDSVFPRPDDAKDYFFAAIIASQAQSRHKWPTELHFLVRINEKISVQLEKTFTDICLHDSTVLDDVVRSIWSGYSAGRSWKRLSSPAQRWWTTSTCEDPDRRPVIVHLNLVDGSFLLNGKNSNTLPDEITRDHSFRLLFQDHIIRNVRPAVRRGMEYEMEYCKQRICLGIHHKKLVIQRLVGNDVEEFIESKHLEGDIPATLLTGHSHWYSSTLSTVEIRPWKSAWWQSTDEGSWTVYLAHPHQISNGGVKKHTPSGVSSLVSPQSSLYKALQEVFSPLEPTPTGIIIASEPGKTHSYDIHLPRYDLHFTLNSRDEIECQSVPGYVVNENRRGIGCFFGLENLLCLRRSIGSHETFKIIVPQGEHGVEAGRYGHPRVCIKGNSLKNCFIYDVDTIVGRLVGTRSPESDTLLIKLHAFTSSSLPDPLTRRTGTSEALSRLQSASSFTFSSITDEWRFSLEEIAGITPLRTFYPTHLKVMETVTWHPSLPVLSQCVDFRYIVEEIISYAETTRIFHQEEELVQPLPSITGMDFLSLRANQRNWIHQSSHIPVPSVTPRSGQPPGSNWNREAEVFRIASLSLSNPTRLPVIENLRSQVVQWNRVTGDRHLTWDRIHEWMKVPTITPISEVWCSIYELCRGTSWPPPFEATCVLAFMGYSGVNFGLISALLAVMKHSNPSIHDLACPHFASLSLQQGSDWDDQTVSQIIRRSAHPFHQSEEANLPKTPYEKNKTHRQRTQRLYNVELDKQVKEATREASRSWPHLPSNISLSDRRLLGTTSHWIARNLYPTLETWLRNRTYLQHLDSVQRFLDSLREAPSPAVPYIPRIPTQIMRSNTPLKVQNLSTRMNQFSPPELSITVLDTRRSSQTRSTQSSVPQPLQRMLSRLKDLSTCKLHEEYNHNLEKSIHSFCSVQDAPPYGLPTLDELTTNTHRLSARAQAFQDQTSAALSGIDHHSDILQHTGLLPSITPYTLLQLLSFNLRDSIPTSWVSYIVSFAAVVLEAQRSERMLSHFHAKRMQQLKAEAHLRSNWSQLQHIDWLLVQIDGNFSIRPNQTEVALAMMGSEGSGNRVLQLNMGEGKSSVIVPIVAASVANGDALCRVIVPRAQTKQQLYRLRWTMTDLCNRRIVRLPFNRNTPVDNKAAASLLRLLETSNLKGDIWLAEPEQLLSLSLLGLDKTMRRREKNNGGDTLIKIQQWLHENTRDILDESDDVLHTRQQVIYTMGEQNDLDAAPRRWEVTQNLLSLLTTYLCEPPPRFDGTFYKGEAHEIAQFPVIRIVSEEGRDLLKTFIQQSVRRNDWAVPPGLTSLAQEFITSTSPSPDTVQKLYSYCTEEDEYVMQTLLILRGLVACDILLHGLKDKRWRVNYGLDLSRTNLAIPFRAKDFPSPRSEFGHPDVTILLTCLSYYYQGLDDNMLNHTLKQLLKSSTPDLTYTSWIQSCWAQVPPDFRSIRGINLEEEGAIRTHLYRFLRYNKAVIDFYLNMSVFPKEAKEFPLKLCTSGWDLASEKPHITTGFSGTNDGRFLLPPSIQQHDRNAQLHTNAKVLSYILLPENQSVISLPNEAKSCQLLDHLMGIPALKRPKVILDVGALILDKSNLEFAKSWLSRYKGLNDIKAAIYFDGSDNLMVVSTDGSTQTLVDSPYADRLDQCLVYLDDAHTRGTDLRLPDMQAVVTLGPKLTKDKLVQGCMRMRKLGDGHTLIFMAPAEVLGFISNVSKTPKKQINSHDILIWAIVETWAQLQSNFPAWVLQGYSFSRRQQAWRALTKSSQCSPQDLSDKFCEKESRTLEDLYGVKLEGTRSSPLAASQISDDSLISAIMERCKNFDTLLTHYTNVNEEMEVELVHEKEMEREVERLPAAQPEKHVLRRGVVDFVKTGQFSPQPGVFRNARDALSNTALNLPRGFDEVFQNLYFTEDFCRTIQLPLFNSSATRASMSQFLRPVEWLVTPSVISSSGVFPLVALSPFETNELIPSFRTTKATRLHLFHARSNLSMRSLESLCSFSLPSVSAQIPPRAIIQLNLFSGSLYIRDEHTYKDICKVLRLHLEELPEHLARPDIISSTRFVKSFSARKELGIDGPGFEESPLPFLRQFITLRRYGKGFGPAHMGKILHGTKVESSDFVQSVSE